MTSLMSEFRNDISTNGDSMFVLVIGIGFLILYLLMLLDSEATLLMLFLVGVGYFLAIGYLATVCHLFVRMLRRRDVWLLYFVSMSAAFIAFLFWLLSLGIISHNELSRLFMLGGIPYSIVSIVFGIAMQRCASNSNVSHHDA